MARWRLERVTFGAMFVALAACSSPSSAGAALDGAAPAPSFDGSAATPEGGSGDDAGSNQMEAGAVDLTNTGAVIIYPLGVTAPGTEVTAAFSQGQAPLVLDRVTLGTLDAGGGSCSATTQATAPKGGGGGTLVSAGTITVSGGRSPIVLMPSFPDGGFVGNYVPAGDAQPRGETVFPGDVLTIAATGATVPAFSITVPVPNTVTVTQPDLAHSSVVTVSRSQDFAVAWSGGGTGTVSFGVQQIQGGALTTVACAFPESAGGGAIPAGLLAYLSPTKQLDAGGTAIESFLFAQSSPLVNLSIADWTVTISVQAQVNLGANGSVGVVVQDGTTAADPESVDAGVGCPAPQTDAGVCTSIQDTGSPVQTGCATDAPPPMIGGAIAPGAYVLVSEIAYLAPDGGALSSDDGGTVCDAAVPSQTILIDGGCLETASTAADGTMVNRSMAYALSGSTLLTTGFCNSSGTSTAMYTATPTSLTLRTDGAQGTFLSTYLRQ